ncbi:hypothetical protein AAMO2058_000491500 [Amorphochlora amoebiformis]
MEASELDPREQDEIRSNWRFAAVCQFFDIYQKIRADFPRDNRCSEFTAEDLEVALIRPLQTPILKDIVTTLLTGGYSNRINGYELWHEQLVSKLDAQWQLYEPGEVNPLAGKSQGVVHFNDVTTSDRLLILHWLCCSCIEDSEEFRQKLRKAKVDSEDMRPQLLGEDAKGNQYFSMFNDFWVFKQAKIGKGRGRPRHEEATGGWSVVCTTEEELTNFAEQLDSDVKAAKRPKKRGRKKKSGAQSTGPVMSDSGRAAQVELVEEILTNFIPRVAPLVRDRKRRRVVLVVPRKRSSRLARKEELEARKKREIEERAEAKRQAEVLAEQRKKERARAERVRKRELDIQKEQEAMELSKRMRIERAQLRKQRLLQQQQSAIDKKIAEQRLAEEENQRARQAQEMHAEAKRQAELKRKSEQRRQAHMAHFEGQTGDARQFSSYQNYAQLFGTSTSNKRKRNPTMKAKALLEETAPFYTGESMAYQSKPQLKSQVSRKREVYRPPAAYPAEENYQARSAHLNTYQVNNRSSQSIRLSNPPKFQQTIHSSTAMGENISQHAASHFDNRVNRNSHSRQQLVSQHLMSLANAANGRSPISQHRPRTHQPQTYQFSTHPQMQYSQLPHQVHAIIGRQYPDSQQNGIDHRQESDTRGASSMTWN